MSPEQHGNYLGAFCILLPKLPPIRGTEGTQPRKSPPEKPQSLLSFHCRAIPPTSWSTSACSSSCGQQGLCFAVKLDFVPFPSTPLVTSGKTVTWKRQMGQGKSCLRLWQSLPHTLSSRHFHHKSTTSQLPRGQSRVNQSLLQCGLLASPDRILFP